MPEKPYMTVVFNEGTVVCTDKTGYFRQERLLFGDALQQCLALPVGVKTGVHREEVATHIDQFPECANRQATPAGRET